MMQHGDKPGLEKNPVQWSRQVDFQEGLVTFKAYMVCTTSDKKNLKDFSRMFQRQITAFKD